MPPPVASVVPPHGVWGPPTATIDWCERNYAVTPFLAEFWNSLSSLVIVALTLLGFLHMQREGFERRFLILQCLGMVVGLGSFLYHATLLYSMQMMDEIPMVWTVLSWIYVWVEKDTVKPRYPMLPYALVAYAVLWSGLHQTNGFTTIFQVHFGLLVFVGLGLLGQFVQACPHPAVRATAYGYVGCLLLAFVLWTIDQACCHGLQQLPFNPELHAWWHVLSGVASYSGFMTVAAARLPTLGYPAPRFTTRWLLPFLHGPASLPKTTD